MISTLYLIKRLPASPIAKFDADVIQAFKQAGDGWQTRMNNALRDWLATHPNGGKAQ
jgi:hypothetical protein